MQHEFPVPPEDCLVHLRTTESVRLRTLFETLHPILVEGRYVLASFMSNLLCSFRFNKKGMSLQALNLLVYVDMMLDSIEDCKN